MALIECVPNYSEGRRKDVIEAIVAPFKGREGCYLFDYRADEDHNRLVVSLCGEPSAVCDALVESAKVAVANIDINTHRGAHPRIGAIDVIPFTPVSGITMDECVRLSRDFAKRYYDELKIPVFYYEASAVMPGRSRLEQVRGGQYEALKDLVKTDPSRAPDVGAKELHPTAGGTAIGARKFLVAFNVNLNTANIEIAKIIAKRVRASGGGFSTVKGMAVGLPGRNLTQVSMNLVDYEKTSMYRVLEFIRMEAARWGVTVNGTEVYGMIPAGAMLDSAAYYLQIDGFGAEQVLELKLLDMMGKDRERRA